ncbi:MAG TPA: hypothetical protein VLM90_13830, partial [Candidatus Deferrimicrobium sp.]|nr:hypothetical protein [Candidatus Deferrimicrobium sp.]
LDYFFDLGTVGPRVHHQRAADAAGNPLGEFETGVSLARRLARQPGDGVGRANFDFDSVAAIGCRYVSWAMAAMS